MMDNFTASFYQNFIEDYRWKYITDGLFNTLRITFFAVLIGIFLGFLIAVVRSTYDKTQKLGVLNALCKVYLTVIRGTPMMVQLMIMYFVIFASSRHSVAVATLAFGINSGAYVAEIVRGGIMSVDAGQMEAGRSLGMNYTQTMRHIIIPQAIKNILPALGNEFITLLKETSICGYVGMMDLTKAGDIIRSQTYDQMMPLLGVAVIYLVIVMILVWLLGKLERRLRSGERRS